jgi:hypothetical protein
VDERPAACPAHAVGDERADELGGRSHHDDADDVEVPAPASAPAKPKVIPEGIGTQHASRNPNRNTAA